MTNTATDAGHTRDHNNPPQTLTEQLAAKYGDLIKEVELAAALSATMPAIPLNDQEALDKAAKQVRRMRELDGKVDGARGEVKRPLDAQVKEVQDFFNPVLAKIKSAKGVAEGLINSHNDRKEAAERQALRDAAERERREATRRADAAAAVEATGAAGAADAVMGHAVAAEETAAAMEAKAGSDKVSDLVRTNIEGGVITGTWSWEGVIGHMPSVRKGLGVLGNSFPEKAIEAAVAAYAKECKRLGETPSLNGVAFTRKTKAIVR